MEQTTQQPTAPQTTEPAAVTTQTTDTQTTQQPATENPEAILAEIQKARVENRPANFAKQESEPAKDAKPEDAKLAEPTATEPALDRHEQYLKEKYGASYEPKEERMAKAAKAEQDRQTSIDAMGQKALELQEQLKNTPQENQIEIAKRELELERVKNELQAQMDTHYNCIKQELADRYNSDDTFRAQHDHYSQMLLSLPEAKEFNGAIMASPYRTEVLSQIYTYLDTPEKFNSFIGATSRQRMDALATTLRNIAFKPRQVTPAPATRTTAPTAAPAATTTQTTQAPAPVPIIAPGDGIDGGTLDMNNPADVHKDLKRRGLI